MCIKISLRRGKIGIERKSILFNRDTLQSRYFQTLHVCVAARLWREKGQQSRHLWGIVYDCGLTKLKYITS